MTTWGPWVDHPLSAFISDGVLYGGTSHVQYSGGVLSRLGTGSFWRFALPDITLGPTDVTEIEITYGAAGQNPSTAFNVTLVIALDALSGATFDDFSDLGTTKIDPPNDNAVTADTQTYTLTVGPGVYVPDNAAGEQANFDTYVATGARPYVMFRNSGNVTTIAGIRTRVLVTDPTAPVPDPPPYGGGSAPPPDGGGPLPGAGPNPSTGGGYQTFAIRRQAPTTAQVVIDGHWLTGLAPWGELAWSHVWPGGSGNASWTAEQVPASLRKRGLSVQLMYGMECIWSGVQTEPDPTGATMNAAGLWTIGPDWIALDGSGNASVIPDVAIDAAIGRGMPWLRTDSISTSAVDIDTTEGPTTIGELLDAYALSVTQRWGVNPDGYVYCTADPVDPKWHVLPLDGGLIPADNFATRLFGRYYNGSAYGTAQVSSDPGNNGAREATVDLTVYGTLTLTKAENMLQALLDLGLSRPSWATPIVCGYGDVLSPGAVPVGLERPVAGDLVRVHGHIDETQTAGGRQWTDVLIGQTDVADDTLTLTPMGMVSRTLADVLTLAAQKKERHSG
jgi:hypothetical protein